MNTMQPVSWREERRRDRMAEAQIGREDEAARTQARIAASEASARLRRDELQVRITARRAARKQRAVRRADLAAWLHGHVTDLLFAPVILVPGTLAWSAMAAYGHALFGPLGYALPAFSEGAMWAFEARATWTARQHPERPVWHLSAGSLFFAAVGAGLNFLHGLTVIPGHQHGVIVGAVMAIISAAGLVAHQIVNLGPRRTRADRQKAKLERATERRAQAVQRAALSRAAAGVDAHGNASVLFRPGTFTLTRKHGRLVLETVPSAPVWLPWPMVLPGAEPEAVNALDMQAAKAVATYRDWRSERFATPRAPHLAPAPEPHPQPRPARVPAATASAPRSAPRTVAVGAPAAAAKVHPDGPPSGAPWRPSAGAPEIASKRSSKVVTNAAAERHFAADLTAGTVPSERQVKRELHVGQERAKAIREHLVQRRVVVPMRQAAR